MEEKLAQLEAEAQRLQQEIAAARATFTANQTNARLEEENATLRQAILRYAIACGNVDIQRAMMDTTPRNRENHQLLADALKEEADSSQALRNLAKNLQLRQTEIHREAAASAQRRTDEPIIIIPTVEPDPTG